MLQQISDLIPDKDTDLASGFLRRYLNVGRQFNVNIKQPAFGLYLRSMPWMWVTTPAIAEEMKLFQLTPGNTISFQLNVKVNGAALGG